MKEQEHQLVVQLNEPVRVDEQNTPEEVIAADALRAENVLACLHAAWAGVRTVTGVCKLAETTMNVMEKRRKLLCQPYGAAPSNSGRAPVIPLD